jgi:hypothetical protein
VLHQKQGIAVARTHDITKKPVLLIAAKFLPQNPCDSRICVPHA